MYLWLVPKKLYEFFLQNETDFIKKFEFLVLQNFIQVVQSILAIALLDNWIWSGFAQFQFTVLE